MIPRAGKGTLLTGLVLHLHVEVLVAEVRNLELRRNVGPAVVALIGPDVSRLGCC